jgi:DNA-binding NarL/FixJ family response regulator
MRLVRQLGFRAAPRPTTTGQARTAEGRTRPDAPRNNVIRVVIVDDHGMFREGIKSLLLTSGIEVAGEARDGAEAVTVVQRLRPDVILLDLDMPGIGGRAALEQLRRTLPNSQVLILTMHSEEERLLPLLDSGARGYLCKAAASGELVDAIRALASGDVYVRPGSARMLAGAMVRQRALTTPWGRFKTLSKREQTILRRVAEGYSGVEIARQLAISTKTVDAYKHRIEDKLGLKHRTAYVRFAVDAGLLGW